MFSPAGQALLHGGMTQRDDVAAMMGERANLKVIPNSRNVPGELTNVKRPSGRGVMLILLGPARWVAGTPSWYRL